MESKNLFVEVAQELINRLPLNLLIINKTNKETAYHDNKKKIH